MSIHFKNSNLFLYIILLVFLSLYNCTTHRSNNSNEKEEEFRVATYSASNQGFKSNSHLIIVENKAILVDAQFNHDDAENVVDLIRDSGKQLLSIIITHPHPDHFYGLEVIGKRFPDVEIYGGEETIKQVKSSSKYWNSDNDDIWDPNRFKVLDGEKIVIEGQEIEPKIFKNSESIENTVLYVQSQKILFIGDLASNKVHMWLAEGELQNWINNLNELEKIGPIEKIYPGHGPESDKRIITEAKNYINNLNYVIANSDSSEEAIINMKKIYPQYDMPEILEGSIIGLYENKR